MRKVLTLISALALLGAVACSDDDDTNNGTKQDSAVTPDKGADAGKPDQKVSKPDAKPDQKVTKPDQGGVKKLTKSHSGWEKAICFDCHDGVKAKYTHGKGKYKEPDCGPCHGYNGAPHNDHAVKAYGDCLKCHPSSKVPHAAKFKSPDDCIACHYQK